MSNDKKNTALTLLLRWINGEANRHDVKSLEAMAKDDPFLNDALDGYRSQPEADHAASVTRLKANLRRRTENRRTAVFYLLRIAALGTFVVAAWVVFHKFNPGDQTKADAAQITESHSDEFRPAPPESMSTPAMPESQEEASVMLSQQDSENETFVTKDNHSVISDAGSTAAPPPVPPSPAKEQVAILSDESDYDQVPEIAGKPQKDLATPKIKATAESKELAASTRKNQAAALAAPVETRAVKLITGRVMDESGDPLIGATVKVKDEDIGVVTGLQGDYSIEIPASATALQFSYTGFTELEVMLGGETTLDVQLSPAQGALSEVVVTGLGVERERKVISPKPRGGFKKFERYLRKNMRRPDKEAMVKTSGTVSVQFRIKADGSLTDIVPASELGTEFMQEAVRLLREGPKWKGEPETYTTYTVHF